MPVKHEYRIGLKQLIIMAEKFKNSFWRENLNFGWYFQGRRVASAVPENLFLGASHDIFRGGPWLGTQLH